MLELGFMFSFPAPLSKTITLQVPCFRNQVISKFSNLDGASKHTFDLTETQDKGIFHGRPSLPTLAAITEPSRFTMGQMHCPQWGNLLVSKSLVVAPDEDGCLGLAVAGQLSTRQGLSDFFPCVWTKLSTELVKGLRDNAAVAQNAVMTLIGQLHFFASKIIQPTQQR
jgi:hypothetical protein